MHHIENPAYFNAPQTTYGVRRIGPIHTNPLHMNPIQRYNPMGTLSIEGKIIPAPIHSALSGITYGATDPAPSGNKDEGGSTWTTYALWGVGGVVAGGGLYFLLKKMGWM